MKISFSSFFLPLILAILFVARIVGASYVEPLTNPTASNAFGYIDTSTVGQVKDGSLSVWAFTANGTAWFKDQVIAQGALFSGKKGTPLSFGDSTHETNVVVNNSTKTDALQSDTLIHGGDPLWHLCAGPNGELQFCDVDSGGTIDLCTNLGGVQTVVPVGYVRNDDGTCNSSVDEGIGTLTIAANDSGLIWFYKVDITSVQTGETIIYKTLGNYMLPAGSYTATGAFCEDNTSVKPRSVTPSNFSITKDAVTTITIKCI